MSQSRHTHTHADYDDDLQLSKKKPNLLSFTVGYKKGEKNIENRLQWIKIALS